MVTDASGVESMRRFLPHALPLLFILLAGCEEERGIVASVSQDNPEATFRYTLTGLRMNSRGDIYWDVRITNTSDVTISYWHLTLEVETDVERIVTGSLFEGNLSLHPGSTYMARDKPLSTRPSCVNSRNACAISVPRDETVVSWRVIGVYAEGG